MSSIKEIAHKITSISSTQQITKAMKMVSASKLNKVQAKVSHMKAYSNTLDHIVANIVAANMQDNFLGKYLAQRPIKNGLFVIMSSDKGLCGSFNTSIFKYAKSEINRFRSINKNAAIHIMPIGEKASAAFSKQTFTLKTDFVTFITTCTLDQAQKISQSLKKSFTESEYDKIILIYNTFKTVSIQELTTINYLPIDLTRQSAATRNTDPNYYIYEPSRKEILQTLLPRLLDIQLYNAILQSNASEHSVRMMTMNKATDNAAEILKSLKITYNRTRQSAITQEISEIVSGAEALQK